MKARLILAGLLGSAIATATQSAGSVRQHPGPATAATPASAATSTNATTSAEAPAAVATGHATESLTADLERHPYRLFGDKRCYLTPLLHWEQLDAERRRHTPNPMPVWRPFQGTVLQLTSAGSVVQGSNVVLFVKNLPEQRSLTNGQPVAFHAIRIPGQSFTFTNTEGAELRMAAYDYGIPFQATGAPLNLRTNLAALYRAQFLKNLDDQITALENTDNQLREQELYLKRLKSDYRQPRRNTVREQYALTQIGTQRTALGQQIANLKKQKTQLEAAADSAGSAGNPTASLDTNQDAVAISSPTNAPANTPTNGPARTNPRLNRYRAPSPPPTSP
ncbi:MAG: hypothetical protein KGS61_03390 [Verrucomicrobia bacterium]|nr:hypothetical protein [Verrucomicrobiota bacterium]